MMKLVFLIEEGWILVNLRGGASGGIAIYCVTYTYR